MNDDQESNDRKYDDPCRLADEQRPQDDPSGLAIAAFLLVVMLAAMCLGPWMLGADTSAPPVGVVVAK